MFDGRHCTREDLSLLIKETDRIKLFLNQQVEDIDRLVNRYLSFIERYDADIAESMRMRIDLSNIDYEKLIKVIDTYIELLEQNVIIDINEHK